MVQKLNNFLTLEICQVKKNDYLYYVIREIDMKKEKMFLEGIGWVLETTYFRLNADNVLEPYVEYQRKPPTES